MNGIWHELLWIIFLSCGFFAWHFSHKAKQEERKMLIEKGLDPDDFGKAGKGFRSPWVKLAMVVIGLSVGLLIIAILCDLDLIGRSDAIYPAILGLCGGGGLLIAHYIEKRSK
jgi:hypothetical protein